MNNQEKVKTLTQEEFEKRKARWQPVAAIVVKPDKNK